MSFLALGADVGFLTAGADSTLASFRQQIEGKWGLPQDGFAAKSGKSESSRVPGLPA